MFRECFLPPGLFRERKKKMKYPVFIHQTSDNRVMAMCPMLRDFYAEGDSIEEALKHLNGKFLCFLHDDEVELEIILIGGKAAGVTEEREESCPPGAK